MTRERLSVTIEADLLEVGRAAVAAGEAESLSAWVNSALRRQADHERRLRAADAAIAAYEAEFGEITNEEIAATSRKLRDRAVVVRGKRGRGVA